MLKRNSLARETSSKSLNEESKNWLNFLEEVTFPSILCQDILHTSLLLRLIAIQTGILTHRYPEDTPLDEWTGTDQIEERN